jgi:hypothetical protein
MHVATNDAAPICSTTDQAKVLLIAEYKSYMFDPFKFTLLRLSGKHTVYKKQVNVILSNIIEGHGRGKVVSEKVGKMQTGKGRGS